MILGTSPRFTLLTLRLRNCFRGWAITSTTNTVRFSNYLQVCGVGRGKLCHQGKHGQCVLSLRKTWTVCAHSICCLCVYYQGRENLPLKIQLHLKGPFFVIPYFRAFAECLLFSDSREQWNFAALLDCISSISQKSECILNFRREVWRKHYVLHLWYVSRACPASFLASY